MRITLQGAWIWIFATGMDEGEPPQFLFNVGDGPAGWVTVRRFVAALERSGIKSLRDCPKIGILLQIRACTTTRYSVAELWMNEEGKDLYPSTLTDAEWNWMESLLPEPAKLGRPPRYSKREVLNGIFYITRSGCGWRMMPKDLPPSCNGLLSLRK